MQTKMKKRIIAVFMFTIVMIYLSISVSAKNIDVAVSNYWIIALDGSTDQTAKYRWNNISEMPYTFVSSPLNTITNIFLMSKMAEIPKDDSILVWSIEIENTAYTKNLAFSELGFIPSSSVASQISLGELNAIDYNQNVIAKTIEKINTNTVRYTTTVKIGNPTSNYIIWRFGTVGLYDTSNTNRIITELNVYETIEDAAGSGLTPEEMREVLNSWGEEELLPGIQDSVQSGVVAGMEEALADEKNQASSGAQSGLDELAGALSGVTEDISQAKQSFETLGSALSYSGTSASLTFPAMTVPFLGTISEAQPINLTEQIDNIMPPTLLLIIRCALSIGIVSYPIFELITQLRKLLDKG